ncbi:MAG: DUF3078 domain-containing protein [Flavobacteriaceae bacterium]
MNTKRILAIVLMFSFTFIFAQDKEEVKDGWKKGGNASVTFNQAAFNNEWTGGGISNMAANVLVNYDMNMVKGDLIWDNKLIADYGAFKNKGQQGFTKSNDRLEFNSLAGLKAKGNWFYSGYFNLKTQLDQGYLYAADGTTRTANISHFFSPAFFQAGPGMLWKKSDNLHVNISPAAAKYIVVHNEFAGAYGTDPGETSAFELGASLRGYYKLDIAKNISMENLLGLYTNYLDEPQNVDVDYTMNLVMTINKLITTNLSFQAIYDDNIQRNGFQIREAFGVGVNFNF